MSTPQRWILVAAVLLILGTGLYPPFEFISTEGRRYHMGFGWFFLPFPKLEEEVVINTSLLITEWLGILILAALLWLAASPGRRPTPENRPQEPDQSRAKARPAAPPPQQSTPPPIPKAPVNESPPASPTNELASSGGPGVRFWVALVSVMAATSFIFLVINPIAPLVGWSIIFVLWANLAFWSSLPLLSSKARAYRNHCSRLDFEIIEAMLKGHHAAEDRRRWKITEKQRIAALDAAIARKLEN